MKTIKDYEYFRTENGVLYDFVTRTYHAWLVLTDKAMAVRFKEDDKGIEEDKV